MMDQENEIAEQVMRAERLFREAESLEVAVRAAGMAALPDLANIFQRLEETRAFYNDARFSLTAFQDGGARFSQTLDGQEITAELWEENDRMETRLGFLRLQLAISNAACEAV